MYYVWFSTLWINQDWIQYYPPSLSAEDADNLRSTKRGLLQSIFCCWRRTRARAKSNGGALQYNESAQGGRPGGQSSSQLSGGRVRNLLPPVRRQDMHRKCMVIDLDETLVHSSFKVSEIENTTEGRWNDSLDFVPPIPPPPISRYQMRISWCRWRSTAPCIRCTCWSGRMSMSFCGKWASCTSACCSPHRWPSTPIRWPIYSISMWGIFVTGCLRWIVTTCFYPLLTAAGTCSERGCFANRASTIEATTWKIWTNWDAICRRSSSWTTHQLVTFSIQTMRYVCVCIFVCAAYRT